ncbi:MULTISPECIES: hypothetical protein [Klebsiella]|uniref:hypothetical protein n=1 Tax=Klebsiella TaxID=570 RepID=UPI0024DEA7CF|nr:MULTISPECIES: hypothetical protein [unclassified Klebsiella]MDK1842217.1 hypothetical protein [Klebsiella sp. K5-204]
MTDITELAQRNELLIANGQQTADLLRHLADNEIDSDYFAVVSECESYGKETEAELSITEFALRAAGYVDALVEALEKAQQRIVELDRKNCELDSLTQRWAVERAENADRIAELESRTVKLPHRKLGHPKLFLLCPFPYYNAEDMEKALAAAGIKWEAE